LGKNTKNRQSEEVEKKHFPNQTGTKKGSAEAGWVRYMETREEKGRV